MSRTLHAVVAILLLLAPAWAPAATQRTFVSVAGTSNPNCSLTAPCRSFAEAIAATNTGGEIVVLDSGGYGPVTVTKSVSIIAPPGIYAGVSVFGANGIAINAPGATVVLRGLSINGQGGGIGIEVQAAARVRIENCVVSNLSSHGIYHSATSAEMVVLDTIVRDNAASGVAMVSDGGSTVLDHVRIEHSGNDGFYLAATAGSAGVLATVVDTVATHNGVNGMWADTIAGSTTTVAVQRSVFSYNAQNGFKGVAAAGTQSVTLDGNMANDNGGNGIWLYGHLVSAISRNTVNRNVGDGILIDSGAQALASGNTGTSGPMSSVMACINSSTLFSLKDNAVWSVGGPCYSTVPGF